MVLLALTGLRAFGLDFTVGYVPGERVRMLERSDLRRYVDGRFVGLAYREVRGILDVVDYSNEGAAIEANYFVLEETKHSSRDVARRIDRLETAEFRLSPKGHYKVELDAVHPTLRGFPVFPAGDIEPGHNWQDFGERVVEPLRDGVYTRVRFYCDYRYTGAQVRGGRNYEVITAQYAMRYNRGDDPYGDERIRRISGKHVVTIYYDPELLRPAFMSDTMDEQYDIEGEDDVALKGFILTWYEDVTPMDRSRLAEEVERALEDSEAGEVEVEQTDDGVLVRINNIRFVADQAVVLPSERSRLDALAAALATIEGRSFLVVGHTARYGTEESQLQLSVERAKAVVDFLVDSGLDGGRFIYEGRGGTEPVAPNDTEENMARNRRVEIIVLEN